MDYKQNAKYFEKVNMIPVIVGIVLALAGLLIGFIFFSAISAIIGWSCSLRALSAPFPRFPDGSRAPTLTRRPRRSTIPCSTPCTSASTTST